MVDYSTFLVSAGAVAPGVWALVKARRENIKTSELTNFDFWISDRVKKLLEDLDALGRNYIKEHPEGKSDLVDTSVISRLNNFSVRVLGKYHGIAYANEVFLREGNWANIDGTREVYQAFNDSCNALDEHITSMASIQKVIDLCQEVEFHFSDMLMLLRRRMTSGHGLYKYFVFRNEYWKKTNT